MDQITNQTNEIDFSSLPLAANNATLPRDGEILITPLPSELRTIVCNYNNHRATPSQASTSLTLQERTAKQLEQLTQLLPLETWEKILEHLAYTTNKNPFQNITLVCQGFHILITQTNSPFLKRAYQLYKEGITWGGEDPFKIILNVVEGRENLPQNLLDVTLEALEEQCYHRAVELTEALLAFEEKEALKTKIPQETISFIQEFLKDALKAKDYNLSAKLIKVLLALGEKDFVETVINGTGINFLENAKTALDEQNYKSAEAFLKIAVARGEEISIEEKSLQQLLTSTTEALKLQNYEQAIPLISCLLLLGQKASFLDIINVIRQANICINEAEHNGGWTFLHEAASKDQLEVVKVLLAAGADVNARTDNRELPLHHPAFVGHLEVVKALLTAGSNVNTEDSSGNTPLHNAAFREHYYAVETLLAFGANVYSKNNFGQLPIDLASPGKDQEIIALLTAASQAYAPLYPSDMRAIDQSGAFIRNNYYKTH